MYNEITTRCLTGGTVNMGDSDSGACWVVCRYFCSQFCGQTFAARGLNALGLHYSPAFVLADKETQQTMVHALITKDTFLPL